MFKKSGSNLSKKKKIVFSIKEKRFALVGSIKNMV